VKVHLKDEDRAELLSRVVDLLNEGKTAEADKLIQDSGDLGKSVVPFIQTHKMLSGLPLVPKEQMDRTFAKIRRELERRTFERALKHSPANREPLNLERRSDFLILLVHFAKQVWGNVKLVKLLFLLWNEGEAIRGVGDFYSHYAYNYGAFDQDIPKDVKTLEKLGVIEKNAPPYEGQLMGDLNDQGEFIEIKRVNAVYELTRKGEAVAKELVESVQKTHPNVIKDIQSIVEKYGRMSTAKLLSYTYGKYPDYAKNSKVKDKYLR
jgi:hypothetical protein